MSPTLFQITFKRADGRLAIVVLAASNPTQARTLSENLLKKDLPEEFHGVAFSQLYTFESIEMQELTGAFLITIDYV